MRICLTWLHPAFLCSTSEQQASDEPQADSRTVQDQDLA